ncbi:MAG: 50S ribosomal protein L10 [Candidatus Harrisonbacteria bacterium]|nr:50S ribosomal protein L10 [Candidatus Harrisonbacteria bacterium]
MLTKKQKTSVIEEGIKKVKESKSLVFTEFNGVLVEDLKKLRGELKKVGAEVKVLKKRLLNLVLKNTGVSFDPANTKTQLATIFSKGDLTSVAGLVHKFAKDLAKKKKGEFLVAGAYDANENRVVDSNEFKAIATLPPREVLLAQVAMMLTMPIKKLLLVLNERSKKLT